MCVNFIKTFWSWICFFTCINILWSHNTVMKLVYLLLIKIFKFFLNCRSNYIDPTWVSLYSSHGIEVPVHKLFMRYTGKINLYSPFFTLFNKMMIFNFVFFCLCIFSLFTSVKILFCQKGNDYKQKLVFRSRILMYLLIWTFSNWLLPACLAMILQNVAEF